MNLLFFFLACLKPACLEIIFSTYIHFADENQVSPSRILNFEIFSFLRENRLISSNLFRADKEVVLEDIRSHRSDEDPARQDLTLEEYVIWTVHNNISMDFLNLIYQVKQYSMKSHCSLLSVRFIIPLIEH